MGTMDDLKLDAEMDEFFGSRQFDETPGDWKSTPETAEDADDDLVTQKAARIAQPFVSFKETGDRMLQLVSALHTSRVSAYGFTAEAEVLEVSEYAISEQLDNRVCPVCRVMHGRKFRVDDARNSLEQVLATTDPEALRTLQPWPKQDERSIDLLKQLSEQNIVSNNWHIPPYHPWCRGLLVHTGKVPALPDLPQQQQTVPANEQQTTDDFKEFGIKVDAAQVNDWNQIVRAPLGDVLGGFLGAEPKDLLDAVASEAVALIESFRILKQGFVLKTKEKMFDSVNPIEALHKVDMTKKQAQIVAMVVEEEDADLAPKILKSWGTTWQRLGLDEVVVEAKGDVGGYGWAKYGWAPLGSEWDRLRSTLKQDVITKIAMDLPPDLLTIVNTALDSSDPRMIWVVSDLAYSYKGMPLGRYLLSGEAWRGRLDLRDQYSMERFKAYVTN